MVARRSPDLHLPGMPPPARALPLLKAVAALGGAVFCLSFAVAAGELIRSGAIQPSTVFWIAWSIVASALALGLLRVRR